MNDSNFYIARYNNGEIDRKINLTQRDLTLAFISGRFCGFGEGDIKIFKVDLDSVTVTEIPVAEILERIEKNRIARNAAEKRRQQKQIKEKIEALQSQLKK